MGKIVENVRCPLCHRVQALKGGTSLPPQWFNASRDDMIGQEFIILQEAMGGQGKGVKGKVKAKSGFQPYDSKNLAMAYADVTRRDKVIALYRSAKTLVDVLESYGLR